MRRLCCACRRQYTPNSDTLRALNITEADAANIPFYRPVGCDACHQTGYKGRIGIYEVMKISDRIRRMIAQRASEDAIREVAQSTGMLTLGDDALAKVKAGVTTAEELLRVVTEVREMRSVCPGCSGPVALDFVACPTLRPPLERRVSGLRPRPAARLDVLSVLRARHRGAQPSGGCASAASSASCPPRQRHQRHRIQERDALEVAVQLTVEAVDSCI